MSNEELSINDQAHFTWGFYSEFFLETDKGNFVWSDPEYGGNNVIRRFSGSYKYWCKKCNIPFGRDKGMHEIKRYCGPNVKIEKGM